MTRTALYRHYDAAGALLYVGITDCLSGRDKQHAATAHWHADVARTETEWCVSRDHALALESVAVQFEAPLHNKAGVPANDLPVTASAAQQHIRRIWPVTVHLSADLRVPYTTAASWKQRGNVPSKHFPALIDAAAKRGCLLTLEMLHGSIGGAA